MLVEEVAVTDVLVVETVLLLVLAVVLVLVVGV